MTLSSKPLVKASLLFFLSLILLVCLSARIHAAPILIDQYQIVTDEWELEEYGKIYMKNGPGVDDPWSPLWTPDPDYFKAFTSEAAARKLEGAPFSIMSIMAMGICNGLHVVCDYVDEIDTLYPEAHRGLYAWRWATYHTRDRVTNFVGASLTMKARFVKNRVCPEGWVPVANAKCAREEDVEDEERECDDECSLSVGNPINPLTANKFQVESDYEGAGTSPLRLVRTFNLNSPSGKLFGPNWRFGYDRDFSVWKNSARITRANGKAYYFTKSNNVWKGAYSSDKLQLIELSAQADGAKWQLTDIDGTKERFGEFFELRSIVALDGTRLILDYWTEANMSNLPYLGRGISAAPIEDMLKSISDGLGHSISFYYNSEELINYVGLPDGTHILYDYDLFQNLVKVTRQDDTVRRYAYEDPNNPGALTDIYDENNILFAHFAYTTAGDSLFTEHAGGVEHFSLNKIDASNTEVTNPQGAISRYTSAVYQGAHRLKTLTVRCPLNDCTTVSESYDYDVAGNIKERIDRAGRKTTYLYDLARNLETSRTEALGTPSQRTITTVWHPTLRLPTKITEPGRITEYSYDTRAHLALKKVTDTTQVNPIVRSTTYTYVYNSDANNPYIQKLTVDGPRTDVNDVTVYDYDTKGNLSTVTQQTSANTTLITRYGGYDANGRVGTITAPNGVVTQLTYHPRGWLKTRVVGSGLPSALTTTFDYDGVGQLIKVTLPDSSTVTYTYDAAHRLTDIVDTSGNRIHYTLDNAGNRIKEEVTDASGVLAALLVQIQTAQADAQLPHAGEAI